MVQATPLRTALLTNPNVLPVVSNGMLSVKLSFNQMLQILTGVPLTQADLYNDHTNIIFTTKISSPSNFCDRQRQRNVKTYEMTVILNNSHSNVKWQKDEMVKPEKKYSRFYQLHKRAITSISPFVSTLSSELTDH